MITNALIILITFWGCISFIYLMGVFVRSVGKPLRVANHKFWGLVFKPVSVIEKGSNDARYAVRVYKLWGLVPSKWYLVEYSKYSDWEVCTLQSPKHIFFKTSQGVTRLLDNLKPPEDHVTIETRTIEELKMEDLLDDKGSD